MSTDVSTLMQQIYDYFLHLYHQSSDATPGTTFLSFEPIGTSLPPETFKLHPTDTTYSQPLAVEIFSALANIVPAIDADVLQPTGKVVDDFYNVLLSGSQFSPESGDSTLFAALKRQALQTFDQTTLGSLQGPFQLHPAYATPRDWFDPSVEANWTTYTFSTSTSSGPISIDTPPIIQIDPQRRLWTWQVLNEDEQPIIKNPELIYTLPTKPDRRIIERATPNIESRLNLNSPFATQLPTSALVTAMARIDAVPDIVPAAPINVAALRLDLVERSAPMVSRIEANDVASRIPSDPDPFNPEPDPSAIQPIRRTFMQAAKLSELVKTAIRQPVDSSSFTITLKYCLININRPWFSQGFLSTSGWYVPGFATGAFSTGTADNNNGIFPALPVACLAVKDVQITASATDISGVAQQSAAFGPFSLIGRTVDQTTNSLTIDSMHVIGWFCQIMPALPPAASPAA